MEKKWRGQGEPLIYRVCIFNPIAQLANCLDDFSWISQRSIKHKRSTVKPCPPLKAWSYTAVPHLVTSTTIYPVVQSRNLGWILLPSLPLLPSSNIAPPPVDLPPKLILNSSCLLPYYLPIISESSYLWKKWLFPLSSYWNSSLKSQPLFSPFSNPFIDL